MPAVQVDNLLFTFPQTVAAVLYDQWQHYIAVWNAAGGVKAVDVVAVEGVPPPPPTTTWLIEAKDYRIITNPPQPSNLGGLPQTVADKVTDTLAGLADAAVNAADPAERAHAARAVLAPATRIVLHLEPHVGSHTALFPAGFAASVFQTLKRLVAHIDANPLVLNIASTPTAGVPWVVA
jgi:hypothetical protein